MTFEKTNKGQFSFKLSSDDNFLSKKVRRKETEDLIRVRVEEEQRKIPKITSSFSSPFRFLHHIYTRLDYLNTQKNKKFKSFSVAPLTNMKPYYITLDALGIKNLNRGKSLAMSDLLKNPDRLCRNKEVGRSFKTDGTQVGLQFIKLIKVKRIGTKEVARKRRNADAETMAKLNNWRNDKNNGRPKFLVATGKEREGTDIPQNVSFSGKSYGLFHQDSAHKSGFHIIKCDPR